MNNWYRYRFDIKGEKNNQYRLEFIGYKTHASVFACLQFCHSPTQPQLELEIDLILGRNPHHPTHTGTFKALPDNVGS